MQGRAVGRLRRTGVVLLGAIILGAGSAGGVSALPHDGENPFTTPCGDGSHITYTLGKRTAANPNGHVLSPYPEQGIPVPIMYGSTQIGTVEILHSRYCATVWSRVKNMTGGTVSVPATTVRSPVKGGLSSRMD
jgi:hypothetical protein